MSGVAGVKDGWLDDEATARKQIENDPGATLVIDEVNVEFDLLNGVAS